MHADNINDEHMPPANVATTTTTANYNYRYNNYAHRYRNNTYRYNNYSFRYFLAINLAICHEFFQEVCATCGKLMNCKSVIRIYVAAGASLDAHVKS